MSGYRLQIVLRKDDGELLVAEDVDCMDVGDVLFEFGAGREGITSRRFITHSRPRSTAESRARRLKTNRSSVTSRIGRAVAPE